MTVENGPSDEDIVFQTPRNDRQEQNENVPEEATPEEGEGLNTELVESSAMIELRHRALNQIEDLRQSVDTLGPGGSIIRTTFETDFLEQYLELGRAAIGEVVPENRELANLQLEAWVGRFKEECGFRSLGVAHLEILSNRLIKEGQEELASKLLDLWIESKNTWVKSVRVEAQIPQERIDQFLQGVTIEPLDEEAPEQSINCQLTEEMSLEEFKLLIQQAILPKLNDNGILRVRGDNLPPEYFQVLTDEMQRKTDFPIIAVYNKETGRYNTIYDEGGEDEQEIEPTIATLIEACRGSLDKNSIEALAEFTDIDEAMGLAFTLLIKNGIDDPEQFLREMGIIE